MKKRHGLALGALAGLAARQILKKLDQLHRRIDRMDAELQAAVSENTEAVNVLVGAFVEIDAKLDAAIKGGDNSALVAELAATTQKAKDAMQVLTTDNSGDVPA